MNKFAFFWYEFVCQYPCTVGCNFWHSPGSRFTAKFGIRTPPKNKSVSDALPRWRGPRPNRWSAPLGRTVENELNYFFFMGEFVTKYHKTIGCNFWQPSGSCFTAKFGIGTPLRKRGLSDTLPSRPGPRPNWWNAQLGRIVEEESIFFFLYDLVFKYQKTVGCNICQPQGRHFTAKFGIGTPPLTKSAYDRLRNRRGPRPNRCSAHLGRNVEKEYISIFFGLNSSSNTIKQLDATFGSRRGAVLLQIVESAHRLKLKVSLTCYKWGVGPDPIDGLHTLAGTWRKNQFFFFFSLWLGLQIP